MIDHLNELGASHYHLIRDLHRLERQVLSEALAVSGRDDRFKHQLLL